MEELQMYRRFRGNPLFAQVVGEEEFGRFWRVWFMNQGESLRDVKRGERHVLAERWDMIVHNVTEICYIAHGLRRVPDLSSAGRVLDNLVWNPQSESIVAIDLDWSAPGPEYSWKQHAVNILRDIKQMKSLAVTVPPVANIRAGVTRFRIDMALFGDDDTTTGDESLSDQVDDGYSIEEDIESSVFRTYSVSEDPPPLDHGPASESDHIEDSAEFTMAPYELLEENAYMPDAVELRPSTYPHMGRGLFAKRFIPEGAHFASYGGEIVDGGHKDATSYYCLDIGGGQFVDGEPGKPGTVGHMGQYINDPKGTREEQNCYFYVFPGASGNTGVVVVAERNINAGEELFVEYGASYWEDHE